MPANAAPPVLAFSLEDHDKARHVAETWKGRQVVLFLADRKGSEYDKGHAWSSRIVGHLRARTLAGDIGFASIADVRGTPRLARGYVRGMFKPKAGDPVGLTLLDWEGGLFRSYQLAPGAFHVLAFDRSHRLVYQVALREFDPAQLAVVQVALGDL